MARPADPALVSDPAPAGQSPTGFDPSREQALVDAVRAALSCLGAPTGYFPGIGCPNTRALQAAFEAYEPHPKPYWMKS